MKRLDDAIERLLVGFATRASGRLLAIVALLLYAGLGLALPLLLGWPVTWLVSANIVGTAFAASLILVWLAARVLRRPAVVSSKPLPREDF